MADRTTKSVSVTLAVIPRQLSEVSKRSWRTEWVGREEVIQRPETQASFLYPFPYAPFREGGHISGQLLGALFGALFVANPLPPTPFRNF